MVYWIDIIYTDIDSITICKDLEKNCIILHLTIIKINQNIHRLVEALVFFVQILKNHKIAYIRSPSPFDETPPLYINPFIFDLITFLHSIFNGAIITPHSLRAV